MGRQQRQQIVVARFFDLGNVARALHGVQTVQQRFFADAFVEDPVQRIERQLVGVVQIDVPDAALRQNDFVERFDRRAHRAKAQERQHVVEVRLGAEVLRKDRDLFRRLKRVSEVRAIERDRDDLRFHADLQTLFERVQRVAQDRRKRVVLFVLHHGGKRFEIVKSAGREHDVRLFEKTRLQKHFEVLHVRTQQEQIGDRGVRGKLPDLVHRVGHFPLDHPLDVGFRCVGKIAVANVGQCAHRIRSGAVQHALKRLRLDEPLVQRGQSRTCVCVTRLRHSSLLSYRNRIFATFVSSASRSSLRIAFIEQSFS